MALRKNLRLVDRVETAPVVRHFDLDRAPRTLRIRRGQGGSPGAIPIPGGHRIAQFDVLDQDLGAEGAAKVVWMDTQTGKSAPIPDHVRASLETA